MAYGQKFKEIRRANLLSQEEFAKRIGVSRSILSQIEIDKIRPTLEALKAISSVFGVSLDYLMSNERPPKEGDMFEVNESEQPDLLNTFEKNRWAKRIMAMPDVYNEPSPTHYNRLRKIPFYSITDKRYFGYAPPLLHLAPKLSTLQLPVEGNGPFMAFEVAKDMHVRQGEIFVCELGDISTIREGQFILTTTIDGIHTGTIEKIGSDSMLLSGETILLKSVSEVWLPVLTIGPPDMENNLREQLRRMERMMRERGT